MSEELFFYDDGVAGIAEDTSFHDFFGCEDGVCGVIADEDAFALGQAGRLDEARALQQRVTRIFDALFQAADFPDGFRIGAALRGFGSGEGRMPRSDVQRKGEAAVRERLSELLREEGLL